VEKFGRKSLAWASMGLEAHMLDVEGPHVEGPQHPTCWIKKTWICILKWNHGGPNLSPTTITFLLKESKCHFLEA
jgi:hypothetical protein